MMLDDAAVEAAVTPALAVAAAREALRAAAEGTLVAPPRQRIPAGDTDFVFTVGGTRHGVSGFRVYGLWPGESDQLVAVWEPGGRLRGVVVGSRLGQYRTGALGAVAIDVLTPRRPLDVAVIGTGAQAWTQLWATTAVRDTTVTVFSRDPANREAFAARARRKLHLDATTTDSAQDAVEGADCVILATNSATPVIRAEWLTADAHVNSVGPKSADRSELDRDIIATSALVVSDAPVGDDPLWAGTLVRPLGGSIGRPAGRTLYASIGLSGSEVVLAQKLLY
jgi:alanine dehydrogenase